MTTAELESRKMVLIREIVNHFNTEEALQRLAEACSIIRSKEDSASSKFPPQLLQELMDKTEEQIKAGQCFTDKELLEDMKLW